MPPTASLAKAGQSITVKISITILMGLYLRQALGQRTFVNKPKTRGSLVPMITNLSSKQGLKQAIGLRP